MISGFLCLLCGTMLVSCKPARQGEKSSDAFTASMVADVRPIEEIKVSAKMDESSQVRISWNQVSRAASYVVCRSDNDGSEWKKLKELTPDKTSYVDDTAAMGMDYHYKVEAACEYSQTDHFAYDKDQMPQKLTAECNIYTGVGGAFWDQKAMKAKQQKIGEILLTYSFGGGGKEAVEPEGVEIYRGTSAGHMKLLERGLVKDISTQEFDFGKNYVDSTVEQGKTYFYQIRAYALLNGKRVYGKRSDAIEVQAAEPEGVYSLRLVREPDSYRSNIVVALTSTKKENGVLTLLSDILTQKITMMYRMSADYYAQQAMDGSEVTVSTASRSSDQKQAKKPPYQAMKLKADRYSMDGRYFQSVTGDIVLDPQKTVYLELSPAASGQTLLASANLSVEEISFQARYNEGKHLMKLDVKGQKAFMEDLSSDGGYQIWTESATKGQSDQIRIGLLSRYSGNQTLKISQEQLLAVTYRYQRKNDDKLLEMTLAAEKYSTDGVKWKKISGDIMLKADELVYLQLVPQQDRIPYRQKGQRHGDLILSGTYGQNTSWTLQTDLSKGE